MSNFLIGKNDNKDSDFFDLSMVNRHGLIAGATGTGKTVTLQLLAENLSRNGICVFAADIKGDLAGISLPTENSQKFKNRLSDLKVDGYTPEGNPVVFWDVYGIHGHPLRTTVTEIGPLLLSRLLNLNEIQQGVLQAAFSFADDEHLLLLDLKDLRTLLDWMRSNTALLNSKYGNIAPVTIGAIQRALLSLNESGGDQFFGEPALKVNNFFQRDISGKGNINILDATKLILDPRLYCTFLLWLLSELFEILPEVGDQEKPKLVFFFDEAHLLFKSAPKPLLEVIEQLVRLIRSKGVGVYFITQSPADIPETVLGQLSNRIQHALRAFTPKDQKAVKVAAQTLRENPKLDTITAISQLGIGEALVSLLDPAGTPSMVEKIKILPPRSRIGSLTDSERQIIIHNSPFFGMYEHLIDNESAYEILHKRIQAQQESERINKTAEEKKMPGRPRDTLFESIIKSTARTLATQAGQQIIRGILGTIFKK